MDQNSFLVASATIATSEKVKGLKGIKHCESNLAAVWALMVTSGGHTSLSNTMSVLGVPVIAKGSFTPTQRDIDELQESMIEAGKEEKHPALKVFQQKSTNVTKIGRHHHQNWSQT